MMCKSITQYPSFNDIIFKCVKFKSAAIFYTNSSTTIIIHFGNSFLIKYKYIKVDN